MTLRREGVCSNRQSAIWERGWPNRHITFIMAKKANSQFLLLYLQYMWGRGLVENVTWGRGLAENVRIPLYGGRGLKLLKKPPYDI